MVFFKTSKGELRTLKFQRPTAQVLIFSAHFRLQS